MPKIKCDVKNCTYNYDTKCTRKNIDVESMQALIKDETYCESFVPKSNMTMNYEFASFDSKITPSSDVYCNVVNCVYEKNQKWKVFVFSHGIIYGTIRKNAECDRYVR